MAQSITQGDLFTFSITPKDSTGATYDLSVGTWSCEVGVYARGAEHIRKTITTLSGDNTAFEGYLSSTESASLAAGVYTLAAQVERTDVTPVISLEMQVQLTVNGELIN